MTYVVHSALRTVRMYMVVIVTTLGTVRYVTTLRRPRVRPKVFRGSFLIRIPTILRHEKNPKQSNHQSTSCIKIRFPAPSISLYSWRTTVILFWFHFRGGTPSLCWSAKLSLTGLTGVVQGIKQVKDRHENNTASCHLSSWCAAGESGGIARLSGTILVIIIDDRIDDSWPQVEKAAHEADTPPSLVVAPNQHQGGSSKHRRCGFIPIIIIGE